MQRFFLLTVILLGMAVSAAWADDVFIRNKPFKGQIYGVGKDIRVSLPDLAKGLDLTLEETPQGWLLGGSPVEIVREHDVNWVSLDSLSSDIVRVVRNKEFGTVDLYKAEGQAGKGKATWGNEGTLVIFGASWCPTTAAMSKTFAELQNSQVVRTVYVDVEAMGTPYYKEYAYLFEGDKIPYFVLLGSNGKKTHSFTGFQTYPQMLDILKKHLAGKP